MTKTTKTMALALVLLAGASGVAMAQDGGRERGPRGERGGGEQRAREPRDREPQARVGPSDQAPRAVGRGVYTRRAEPASTEAREAPRPPEARPAPQAPDAGGQPRRGRGGQGGGQTWTQSGRWVDRDGDADTSGLTGRDLQDHEDRVETRDWNMWNGQDGRGQRGDGNRGDGRREGDRGRDRPDGDRRADGDRDGRGDGDRSGWNRGDRNGGDRDRGDGDRRWQGRDGRGPPANVARWDRRRYPSIYNSGHRYRGHVWRAPVGFYVRAWSFGEVLPRGWYDTPYRLGSWWDFGLPMPPPGYDWVRVGYDAVLVDTWSGRIVQVVRMVFW